MREPSKQRIRTDDVTEREVDRTLARAVLFRALKLGFQGFRSRSDSKISFGDPSLICAAHLLDPDSHHGLVTAVEALSTVEAGTAESYDRVFGHTARGQACPYETEYGRNDLFQQAQTLADIAGSYLAFGLQPTSAVAERVDHVAVECEFMEFLAEKAAYLLESGDQESLQVTQGAYRSFLGDHLIQFGPALARTLYSADGSRFYGCLAGLLQALLSSEGERLELRLGLEYLSLRSASQDDAPMACSSGSDLVQVE